MAPPPIRAVFFDVDFTLIRPGPMFQGEGYAQACEARGLVVDAARFDEAVTAASAILDEAEDPLYDDRLYIQYTASIIEGMGGSGPQVQRAARDLYDQWAGNHHFTMYDDAAPVLRALVERGLTVGVISNSHRSLDAFQEHFDLRGLIHAAVGSSEHGYLKPHRSIFDEALRRAGATAGESLMVGDSLKADVLGALSANMRAVLLRRSGERPPDLPAEIRVIATLRELLELV